MLWAEFRNIDPRGLNEMQSQSNLCRWFVPGGPVRAWGDLTSKVPCKVPLLEPCTLANVGLARTRDPIGSEERFYPITVDPHVIQRPLRFLDETYTRFGFREAAYT